MNATERLKEAKTLEVPAHVIQHKAVLTLPDGTAISEVVETTLRSARFPGADAFEEMSGRTSRPESASTAAAGKPRATAATEGPPDLQTGAVAGFIANRETAKQPAAKIVA